MAEINTLALLKTHWATGGTHTIVQNTDGGSSGIYWLDADIICTGALTLTATEAISITGIDTYDMIIDGADFTIGGSSGNVLTFQNGNDNTITIKATSAGVTGVFNYCAFDHSFAQEGLEIDGALAGVVSVTCNNCTADDNEEDGFGINAAAVGFACTLTCNDCTATNHRGSGIADGFTAHRPGQTLVLRDCVIDNCTKGVAIIGNNDGVSDGPALDIDGLVVTNCDYGIHIFFNQVYTSLDIKNVNISALTNTSYTGQGIFFDSDGTIAVDNCIIKGIATNGIGFELKPTTGAGITATIENCIVYGFLGTNISGLRLSTSNVDMKNSVFYNNDIHVYTSAGNIDVYNCIFEDSFSSTFGAWLSTGGNHYTNSSSDYNFFYNNVNDFDAAGDVLAANDLSTDPGMVDPANDDFSITSSSNVFEAGNAATAATEDILGVVRSDPPDIGAYEFVAAPAGGDDYTSRGFAKRFTNPNRFMTPSRRFDVPRRF